MKLEISIIYDNTSITGFKHGWGFSTLIKVQYDSETKNILFDTGANKEILFYNMEKLKINPKNIDIIVLSHPHFDHAGGLPYILKIKDDVDVYLPKFIGSLDRTEIYSYGSNRTKFIDVEGIVEITDNVKCVCTKEIFEQFLMVHLSKGLFIISGCAHPGLGRIIDFTKNYGKIFGVMGGFHGFAKLEKLKDIDFIAPCHCTSQTDAIKRLYQDKVHDCGAGKQYELI
ncbi:MAG: MBL fold metallo-hydrolase [Candidatus Helarchaeota archaeon]